MLPIRDINPARSRPWVTWGLIVLCFLVFLYELSLQGTGGEAGLDAFITRWGAVPKDVTEALGDGRFLSEATLDLITSQFLHGGWLHILGNMLYLYIFGNNVEDVLGPFPYLVFYLVAGIVAGLTQVVIDPTSTIPLVGASGAIAGVLGAYLVLFPHVRVQSVVFFGYFFNIVQVPAIIVLGFWFVLQLVSGIGSLAVPSSAAEGGVATFAHIGGFVLGVVVGLVLRAGRGRTDRVG